MAENSRAMVLDMLLAMDQEKEFSNRLIRSVLDKYDYLDYREKAFIKRLAEGTLERQLEMDYYLNHFSRLPVNKMRPVIRCLLRMSVYQLLYMDSVPDSAVCNEACKLAAKRGFGSLKGFVNGILRNISKNRDSLPLPDREKQPAQYCSVKYSMPQWIVELWMDEYGREITETLLDGLMKVHPVSLRFSSGIAEGERDELCRRMEEAGAKPAPGPYLPGIFLLEHTQGIGSLPGFAQGAFTVQDVSSVLAVEAAGIGEQDFVVDVCGAPGGKSILAAEKAKKGRVLSRDVSAEKTMLIAENASRMGIENIEIEVYDASVRDDNLMGKADVVLADVPCSGLGVIGKKRDIKYRVTREGMESLAELQRQILGVCAGYVRPGGTLLYSTCTIHRKENEDMVRYLVRELGFEPVSLEDALPEKVFIQREKLREELRAAGRESGGMLTDSESRACIQLLPGYMDSDGFFFAKFRKKECE